MTIRPDLFALGRLYIFGRVGGSDGAASGTSSSFACLGGCFNVAARPLEVYIRGFLRGVAPGFEIDAFLRNLETGEAFDVDLDLASP